MRGCHSYSAAHKPLSCTTSCTTQSARARAFCIAHSCVPCAAGKAIKGIPRDKIVIASKWGPRFTVSYCRGSQMCRRSYCYWGLLSFTVVLACQVVV